MIGKEVLITNPDSARFGQRGKIIGTPQFVAPHLSEAEKIKRIFERKIDEVYIVRFSDGEIFSFGLREMQVQY
jgi:hypothetical protein